MNVLIVSNGYPDDKNKGLGIFEYDQARSLHDNGCRVIIAAVDIRSIRKWRKWGIERKEVEGIKYYVINIPGLGGKMPWILKNYLNIFGLYILFKIIKKDNWRPDYVHGHFTSIGYAVTKLKGIFLCPVVVTEHSSLVMKTKKSNGFNKTARATYKKADALIAVSPTLRDYIYRQYKIKPLVIPNIVDVEKFKYKEKENTENFTFISVGNLIYGKRMDLTIEAFYKEFDEKNTRLIIFGKGPEMGKLQNIIRENGLKDRVILMGEQNRGGIALSLNESQCFVLASQSETFGVAYIEALACGAPVIATKCGGPEYFINEDNGILVEKDDLYSLRKAMRYMYHNSNKYNGKYISESIKNKFSGNSISNQIISVYKSIGKDSK